MALCKQAVTKITQKSGEDWAIQTDVTNEY